MTYDEIVEAIISLAENDQSIDDVALARWIANGIDRINITLNTSFPSSLSGTEEPAFDSRFHESLILFGVAKYRESDSSYNDAQYFMQQFNDMIMVMQRDMEIPAAFRKDKDVQQIVVTNPTTLVYDLSMPYGSYFDYISVYKNNELVNPISYRITLNTKKITFQGISLVSDDRITVIFENNSDLNAPPYQWWNAF
jgi:hypothetical protein